MRTTLTLDDDIAARLKEMAFKSGRSFKEVVNSVLSAGLEGRTGEPEKPYQLEPVSMGNPRSALDLDKALQIASILEDEEIQRKLELRK